MSILACPIKSKTDWVNLEESVGRERGYEIYSRMEGNVPVPSRSNLYKKLSSILSEEDAKTAFYNLHSIEFMDFFGDFIFDPENASSHVDENGDPILYERGFQDDNGNFMPLEALLEDLPSIPSHSPLNSLNSNIAANRRSIEGLTKALGTKFGAKVHIGRFEGNDLGWVENGEVYINLNNATHETPIHEFGHLFVQLIRGYNRKLWANLVKSLNANAASRMYLKSVKDRYSDVYNSEDQFLEEAIVEMLTDSANGNLKHKSLNSWIKEFIQAIAEFFTTGTQQDIDVTNISPRTSIDILSKMLIDPSQKILQKEAKPFVSDTARNNAHTIREVENVRRLYEEIEIPHRAEFDKSTNVLSIYEEGNTDPVLKLFSPTEDLSGISVSEALNVIENRSINLSQRLTDRRHIQKDIDINGNPYTISIDAYKENHGIEASVSFFHKERGVELINTGAFPQILEEIFRMFNSELAGIPVSKITFNAISEKNSKVDPKGIEKKAKAYKAAVKVIFGHDTVIKENIEEGDFEVIVPESMRVKVNFPKMYNRPRTLEDTYTPTKPEITPEDRLATLERKMKSFLSNAGIKYNPTTTILDEDGQPINVKAKADVFQKILHIVEGKATMDTLPEEASHFFVEMLPEDNTAFQSMMRKIEGTEVYKSVVDQYGELYQGNVKDLKKEAIGKLIAAYILQQAEVIDNVSTQWTSDIKGNGGVLSAIWKWLKRKLNILRSEQFDPIINEFEESARDIVEGNLPGIRRTPSPGVRTSFYALNEDMTAEDLIGEQQPNIIRELTSNQSQYVVEKDDTYIVAGESGFTRASTKAKRVQRRPYRDKPTKRQEAAWAIDRVTGTLVHGIVSNIIKEHFSKENAHVEAFTNEDFEKDAHLDLIKRDLEKYLMPIINETKKDGGVLLSEVKVANPKAKVAGSIDLVRVNKNGTLDIFDFKTKSSNKITFPQEQEYTVQVEEYAKALQTAHPKLNRSKYVVNQKRIIPIGKRYNFSGHKTIVDHLLKNLKTFTDPDLVPFRKYIYKVLSDVVTGKGVASGEVEQIPIITEATDNKDLNNLISKLSKQIKQEEVALENIKDSAEKESLRQSIVNKRNLIKDIQLRKDVESIAEAASRDLSYIRDRLLSEDFDFDTEYRIFSEAARMYQGVSELIPLSNKDAKLTAKASQVSHLAGQIIKELKDKTVGQFKSEYSEDNRIRVETEKLISPQKAVNRWHYLFQGISFTHHPLLAAAKIKTDLALGRAKDNSLKLNQRISKALEGIDNYYGKKSIKNFDIFAQKDDNGKNTGNFVSKYSLEFWRTRREAISEGNRDWLKENTEVDKERYQRRVEARDKYYERQYETEYNRQIQEGATETDAKAKAKKHIAYLLIEWKEKYEYNGDPNILYFNKPKEESKWLDPNYKKIASVPQLKAFYDVWTEVMIEAKETLPFRIDENFFPNFTSSFLEMAGTVGIGAAMQGMSNNLVNRLEATEEPWSAGLQSASGENINKIPVAGLQQDLTAEEKSYDMGRVLSAFGESMYKHQELESIHSLILATNDFMKDQIQGNRELVTDDKGNPILDKYGNKQTTINKSGQLAQKQLEDFVDTIYYGRHRNSNKARTQKIPSNKLTESLGVAGKQMSWGKILDEGLMYVALKNLGLNFFSPTVNLGQGITSALIEGAGGRYYSPKQFMESLGLILKHDKFALALAKKFDIVQREFSTREAARLSRAPGRGQVTTDKAFYPQEFGEEIAQNAVLLAILKSGKNAKFNIKNYKLMDGELKWVGKGAEPSIDAQTSFAMGVKQINYKIVGNYDTNNRMGIKKYFLGRAVMQHRTWLPAMAENRFGTERYDYILDEMFIGRYKALTKKAGWEILKIYAKKGFFFTTKEDFKGLPEHYLHAIRADLMEAMVVGALMMMRWGLSDAPDREQSGLHKYVERTNNRLLSETMFFYSLPSFMEVVQSPAPAVSAYEDLGKMLLHTGNTVWGSIKGDEDILEKSTPGKYVIRNIPIAGQTQRFFEFMADDTDR